MKILLINPPHPAIGSRIPREHLPPLGLLSLGGPLLDAGHIVRLLDGELGPMSLEEILEGVLAFRPDAVLVGHSGSTSAHPCAVRIMRAVRHALPNAWIIYGGVFPTYHWPQIIEQEPEVDIIVRGEGEETIVRLAAALAERRSLKDVPGIVFRSNALSAAKREVGPAVRSGPPKAPRPFVHPIATATRQLFVNGFQNISSFALLKLESFLGEFSSNAAYTFNDQSDFESQIALGGPLGTAGATSGCHSAEIIVNPPAPVIRDLDACRIAWELIDHRRYSYYGQRRAVVVQFSRGCPHHCHYCGQHGFWRAWRHRDPAKFAAEIARLNREFGVEVFNLADENPTASRPAWQSFLEALIAENVNVTIIGTTRAGDIVRDADILHLYKRAGCERFLLGLESTDDATLQAIHKGSTQAVDREAIRLMRQHGIISMAAWVAGFVQEKDADYWRTLRQLLSYDPDQIQALYATPHSWTPFGRQEGQRRVIQPDLSRWDYKHQILESQNVPNWRVLLWVKAIEAICQLRPRALLRLFAHPDKKVRAGMRWYSNIGRRVWLYEILQWLHADRRTNLGPKVADFLKGAWSFRAGKVRQTYGSHKEPKTKQPHETREPVLA